MILQFVDSKIHAAVCLNVSDNCLLKCNMPLNGTNFTLSSDFDRPLSNLETQKLVLLNQCSSTIKFIYTRNLQKVCALKVQTQFYDQQCMNCLTFSHLHATE